MIHLDTRMDGTFRAHLILQFQSGFGENPETCDMRHVTCVAFLHLQHPGSESVIQQDVEAQNLKAGAAGGVVGEAGVVVVLEDGMSRDQSLDDHVLNVGPHLLRVAAQ